MWFWDLVLATNYWSPVAFIQLINLEFKKTLKCTGNCHLCNLAKKKHDNSLAKLQSFLTPSGPLSLVRSLSFNVLAILSARALMFMITEWCNEIGIHHTQRESERERENDFQSKDSLKTWVKWIPKVTNQTSCSFNSITVRMTQSTVDVWIAPQAAPQVYEAD